MQSDLCTVHAKKLRSNSRIEIPGTANLCRGFRLEGFRCFSKTLLLRHRPASYGRIVVGVSKRISPLSLKHSALLIFLSHLIIILVTRIVRRSRILRRDGENTAIRPVIERNTHTLLSKDTEYASDLQTCEWKSAQKFPSKQPFRREANRNRSTILPKTVLIPRSPPPNAIRRLFRESAAYSAKKEFIFYIF